MNREEILSRLTPIAQKIFEKEDLVLTDELSAETLDSWTSMAFMMFLTEIENQFGFKYKMLELLKLQDMGAIVDSIVTKTNA